MASSSRTVRIFLSSTFRDFGEERDLLVRRVFPGLRARLKDRFVELVDVDLRWGITVEQAERGEVLPICLAEIDRARPYFVGMLGERYGWVPPADAYAQELLEQQGWLNDLCGGKSVTELEILHGVLNDLAMAGRAFFYFRAPAWAEAKGGDYVASSPEDALRQADLKDRIRASGFPIVEDYSSPEAFAERLLEDLWNVLDQSFPADEVPDAFERENLKHEAYAMPRRRLYLGGEEYAEALTGFLDGGAQRVLIEGQSGGGKSALIANWTEGYSADHPQAVVHTHFTGASADAADPYALMRRLVEFIKRTLNSQEEIPEDRLKLIESLPVWLANASAWGSKEGRDWVFVLDALNGITALQDLRWVPTFLPDHVYFVVSCLSGEVMDALERKGAWGRIRIEPLRRPQAAELLRLYLGHYNKTLAADLEDRILSNPLAINPMFLRTLAEELRLFGVHDELSQRLNVYLASRTIDNLFERVLERVEHDCGPRAVRTSMRAIWASRAGLTDAEIQGISELVPATWAPIRHALDNALLEADGKLIFAHDYLRIAVSNRYLKGDGHPDSGTQSEQAQHMRRDLHLEVAKWFTEVFKKSSLPGISDARAAEEIPYQWQAAQDWKSLRACLLERLIFQAVLKNRPTEELLSYWLDLERLCQVDIEADYKAAWSNWNMNLGDPVTYSLANDLQCFLSESGRNTNFATYLARLALQFENIPTDSNRLTKLKYINDLGFLLTVQENYEEAETLYERAVDIAAEEYGSNSSQLVSYINNLAFLKQSQGEPSKAEALYRRAILIEEKSGIDDISDLATCYTGLASIHQGRGEFSEAILVYKKALEIFERQLGPGNSKAAIVSDNMALVLKQSGDFDSALELYSTNLLILQSKLGPAHPDVAITNSNLGSLNYAKGSYAQAELYFRRALSISESTLGPTSSITATRRQNLTVLLMAMKRDPNPESLLVRGDFLSIVGFSKALAKANHTFELNSSLFLGGLIIAAEQDPVWKQELEDIIFKTLREETHDHIFKINQIDKNYNYKFETDKMPVAAELRKIIAAHSRSNLSTLVSELVAGV